MGGWSAKQRTQRCGSECDGKGQKKRRDGIPPAPPFCLSRRRETSRDAVARDVGSGNGRCGLGSARTHLRRKAFVFFVSFFFTTKLAKFLFTKWFFDKR